MAGMSDRSTYIVRGSDGHEYPADRSALVGWATVGLLTQAQQVFDVQAQSWSTAVDILGVHSFPESPGEFQRRPSASQPRLRRSTTLPLAGCLVVILGILIVALIIDRQWVFHTRGLHKASSRAETVSAVDRQAIEKLAGEGVVQYRRLIEGFPNTGLCLTGGFPAGVDAALVLPIPREAWDQLSPHERVALSYFVESQVAVVRRHPAIYSLDPVGAPAWPDMEAAFRSICSTCWSIMIGPYAETGVSLDETVLAGDEHWSRGHMRTPNTRASVFRKVALRQQLKPLTWDVEALDPTGRYHMPVSSERLGHYEGSVFVSETPADRARAWR